MTYKQNVSMIALPVPRHLQLKELAEKRGMSMADTIGDFINEAIAAGEIADVTPGVEVRAGREPGTGTPKIVMPIGQAFLSRMSPDVALRLADVLVDPERHRVLSGFIENPNVIGWDRLRVFGKGSAVVLSSSRSQESVIMSQSIARDLARQLRACASLVQAQIEQADAERKARPKIVDVDAMIKDLG
ncbi:hypothetical protein [Aestuariivirga sp.]|uniref:hypothetical protein n=1 Tax=Aestuariivirga sp. TaxID=2650926 RepID=UPI003BABE2C5